MSAAKKARTVEPTSTIMNNSISTIPHRLLMEGRAGFNDIILIPGSDTLHTITAKNSSFEFSVNYHGKSGYLYTFKKKLTEYETNQTLFMFNDNFKLVGKHYNGVCIHRYTEDELVNMKADNLAIQQVTFEPLKVIDFVVHHYEQLSKLSITNSDGIIENLVYEMFVDFVKMPELSEHSRDTNTWPKALWLIHYTYWVVYEKIIKKSDLTSCIKKDPTSLIYQSFTAIDYISIHGHDYPFRVLRVLHKMFTLEDFQKHGAVTATATTATATATATATS